MYPAGQVCGLICISLQLHRLKQSRMTNSAYLHCNYLILVPSYNQRDRLQKSVIPKVKCRGAMFQSAILQISYTFLPTLHTTRLKLHLRLQFLDELMLLWNFSISFAACFSLELTSPNAHTNDMCGRGFCKMTKY
jgi:hypothetical protein